MTCKHKLVLIRIITNDLNSNFGNVEFYCEKCGEVIIKKSKAIIKHYKDKRGL